MTTAQEVINRATVRRFIEAVNSGDTDLISATLDEIVEPDAVIRTRVPLETTGPDALKKVMASLHRVFPDLHIAVEDLIAEEDKVVTRNVVTGTHRGEYMGLPATDRPVVYDEIFVFRFIDGLLAETWGVVDVLAQMQQLGMVHGPPVPE